LFYQLYSEPKEDDFEIEEMVPESEDDVKKMLAQLKKEGVIN